MPEPILIVEDDPDLLKTLEYNFVREGYRVITATSGERALELIVAAPRPKLVVLDLMLPGLSGLEVCRRLRQSDEFGRIAILILTARGEELDRVVGFEMGADDYLVKPFSVRELLLRVGRILERLKDKDTGDVLEFGPLCMALEAHRAVLDGRPLHLTALEFRLLHTLLERRGRTQARGRLLADVWGHQAELTTRTVDAHIKRLRAKLGAVGACIETVRGVGYRFSVDPPQ